MEPWNLVIRIFIALSKILSSLLGRSEVKFPTGKWTSVEIRLACGQKPERAELTRVLQARGLYVEQYGSSLKTKNRPIT